MQNTFEFTVGLINFILLMFLLKPILFDPLKNVAREREEKARLNIEKAEQILAQAKANLEKYQALNEKLAEEIDKIEAKAKVDCENVAISSQEEAEREAKLTLARAKGDADSRRKEAVLLIRTRIAEETVEKAKVLMKHSLSDESLRQNIIENFLTKVGAGDAK